MENNFNPKTLTNSQRHERLVRIVKKSWQDVSGSRLFKNTSGVAWQGNAVSGAGKVELLNPHPIYFGIPEPDKAGSGDGSGGSDLIGVTVSYGERDEKFALFTAIEIKTGKSKLRANQKRFRDWVKRAGGIYFVFRECPACWNRWEPVYTDGKISYWIIHPCETCEGRGYVEDTQK